MNSGRVVSVSNHPSAKVIKTEARIASGKHFRARLTGLYTTIPLRTNWREVEHIGYFLKSTRVRGDLERAGSDVGVDGK